MAFNQIETSDYYATAVFLYEFQIGENIWRYTAADSDIAAGGAAWQHASIEHDRVSQTGDADQDSVSLTLPSDLIPAVAYIGSAPSQQMMVRFRKAHDGEPQAPVYWVGLVSSVDWPAPGKVTISLIPLSATMQREGLSMTYQRGCRLALYGQGRGRCNVDREAFRTEAEITSLASSVLEVDSIDGLPGGWFSGGFIEWEDPIRGREWRTVEEHAIVTEEIGQTPEGEPIMGEVPKLRMFGLTDGLSVGMTVSVFAGCSRTIKTCDEKFNNTPNFGGQPHLPGDSPFDGDPF